MTEEKRRFKTTIAGRQYTILAKKPEEHLKIVSEIVNTKISQIKTAMPGLDIEQRSVLVAVNAVSESISKQAELDEWKEEFAELEKKYEAQQRTIQSLENRRTKEKEEQLLESQPAEHVPANRQAGPERTIPTEKVSSEKVRTKKKVKRTDARYTRPTTASGVVLQRISSSSAMKSKLVQKQDTPPYMRKKQQNVSQSFNDTTEDR